MNTARSRPSTSAYWRNDEPKAVSPKTSKSVNNLIRSTSSTSKVRPVKVLPKSSIGLNIGEQSSQAQGREIGKTSVGQDKSNRLYSQFRLLYRQTSQKSRLVSASPETRKAATETKKYVVKGQTLNTPPSKGPTRSPSTAVVITRKSSDIDVRSTTPKQHVYRRTIKPRLKDFTYDELYPNYHVDQYYYTREPMRKVQCSSLQNLKSYVDDELQKQRDQAENYAIPRSGHSYSKQKLYSRSTTTSFASGYYIDKNLKGEFTADKKVRIWLEKSKLQSKANKVDISNAWTRQI